jgi:hypothetical protein
MDSNKKTLAKNNTKVKISYKFRKDNKIKPTTKRLSSNLLVSTEETLKLSSTPLKFFVEVHTVYSSFNPIHKAMKECHECWFLKRLKYKKAATRMLFSTRGFIRIQYKRTICLIRYKRSNCKS